jgi:two-component system chemotaxis response regulator CheB
VLLVEDSPTARQMLSGIIRSASDMQLVGEAPDGHQAVQMVEQLRPNIVLMDANLPGKGGLEATRDIMHLIPTPIVIISAGVESTETTLAFEAINAGALSVLGKPCGPGSANYDAHAQELLATLRAMAGVRVIRRWRTGRLPGRKKTGSLVPQASNAARRPAIVAIAASTGGPQTIKEVIELLPPTFNLPVVIVQHISADFVSPMTNWLNTVLRLPICIAQDGEVPLPGTIYLAPGQKHLRMTRSHRFELKDTPTDVLHIPSCDILLSSVAQHYGASAVGIVLTGMGNDGARGLRAMYEAGATTIAQDETTSIVFGMPQEAIALGAASLILPPREISKLLLQLAS